MSKGSMYSYGSIGGLSSGVRRRGSESVGMRETHAGLLERTSLTEREASGRVGRTGAEVRGKCSVLTGGVRVGCHDRYLQQCKRDRELYGLNELGKRSEEGKVPETGRTRHT